MDDPGGSRVILLSLVLVILGAVLLVLGWFQDGLELIYLAIGSCLLAMLLLGLTVLQRRRTEPSGTTAPSPIAPASATVDRTRASGEGDDDAGQTAAEGTDGGDREAAGDGPTSTAAAADDVESSSAEAVTEPVATRPARRDRRAAIVRVTREEPDEQARDHAPTAAGIGHDASDPADGESDADMLEDTAAPPPTAADDALADVRGLGPSRRAALLERFGDVQAIRAASVEELTEVPGMSAALAASVKEQLSGD